MPNRPIAGLIVLCWVAMTGWLVQRDVLPYWRALPAPSYRSMVVAKRLPDPVQWSVFRDDKRIGQIRTEWKRDPDLRYTSTAVLNELPTLFRMLNVNGQISCASDFQIDDDGNLSRFEIVADVAGIEIKAQGTLQQNTMKVRFQLGEITQVKEFSYQPRTQLFSTFSPAERMPNLRLKQTWSYRVVSPFEGTTQLVQCEVVGEELISWHDRPVPTFVVEQKYKGFTARSWVAHGGEVIRQELPIGWEKVVLELD